MLFGQGPEILTVYGQHVKSSTCSNTVKSDFREFYVTVLYFFVCMAVWYLHVDLVWYLHMWICS